MTNLFLKVNKDFFKLGLNPTEILILAQVMEFDTNTGNCFISDEALTEIFGISKSTVSREIKVLESKGFITRQTVNVKGGRKRTMTVNYNKIEEALTSVNLTLDGCQQDSNCVLSSVNLTIDNKQNDSIKDNIKDNIKYNDEISSAVPAEQISQETPEAQEEGTFEHPILVTREWLIARRNELAECNNGVFKYMDNKFYKVK